MVSVKCIVSKSSMCSLYPQGTYRASPIQPCPTLPSYRSLNLRQPSPLPLSIPASPRPDPPRPPPHIGGPQPPAEAQAGRSRLLLLPIAGPVPLTPHLLPRPLHQSVAPRTCSRKRVLVATSMSPLTAWSRTRLEKAPAAARTWREGGRVQGVRGDKQDKVQIDERERGGRDFAHPALGRCP